MKKQPETLIQMAKTAKVQGDNSQGSQKHLRSRILFLYQASSYLDEVAGHSSTHQMSKDGEKSGSDRVRSILAEPTLVDEPILRALREKEELSKNLPGVTQQLGLVRHLLTHARNISKKSQTRLSQSVKRSICKKCDALLMNQSISTIRIENSSQGNRKPWADVLVITCDLCGTHKRFPVGAKRQLKRSKRDNGRRALPNTTTG